jgi:hypothetical protein
MAITRSQAKPQVRPGFLHPLYATRLFGGVGLWPPAALAAACLRLLSSPPLLVAWLAPSDVPASAAQPRRSSSLFVSSGNYSGTAWSCGVPSLLSAFPFLFCCDVGAVGKADVHTSCASSSSPFCTRRLSPVENERHTPRVAVDGVRLVQIHKHLPLCTGLAPSPAHLLGVRHPSAYRISSRGHASSWKTHGRGAWVRDGACAAIVDVSAGEVLFPTSFAAGGSSARPRASPAACDHMWNLWEIHACVAAEALVSVSTLPHVLCRRTSGESHISRPRLRSHAPRSEREASSIGDY